MTDSVSKRLLSRILWSLKFTYFPDKTIFEKGSFCLF